MFGAILILYIENAILRSGSLLYENRSPNRPPNLSTKSVRMNFAVILTKNYVFFQTLFFKITSILTKFMLDWRSIWCSIFVDFFRKKWWPIKKKSAFTLKHKQNCIVYLTASSWEGNTIPFWTPWRSPVWWITFFVELEINVLTSYVSQGWFTDKKFSPRFCFYVKFLFSSHIPIKTCSVLWIF